ncbi:protein croquemort-like [Episyrphus balteatus]|uniref:protein croquemort-like n=1 Tax=Episyrphus balteatus TaxID=286459 RepID=UPI002485E4AB|nr:protein croquemort-like [Episyrphus balteatus]
MFKKWLNPPITNYMYIYLFNWTNMQEATNHNVKPNFNQHGPYVFREKRSKEDIIWHDNDTMTFYNRRTWFFEEEMSGASLDDVIVLPHPPTVIAAKLGKNMNRYVKKVMNYALQTEGGMLAANKTAEKWLFKGFDDPLTEFAALFLTEIISFPLEKFGLLYLRNASKTYEGTYTIHTGQTNLSLLGELAEWQGSNQSYAFKGECGHINGSTGDIFAPKRIPEDSVSVFIPDTCRSIKLFPSERINYRGIETIKYSTNDQSFDNGQLYPNMKCFCSEKDEVCPPTGVIDMSSCLLGAPLYLSLPHFLNADPSYTDGITGMQPDPQEHDFYIIMEPRLGTPLNGNANMQINMLMEPDDSIDVMKDINEFYAPLVIISDRGDLNESFAKLIRNKYSFVAAMVILFLLDSEEIDRIDHKFLEPGHTHMEYDSDRALIERNIETPRDCYQFFISTMLSIKEWPLSEWREIKTKSLKAFFTVLDVEGRLSSSQIV